MNAAVKRARKVIDTGGAAACAVALLLFYAIGIRPLLHHRNDVIVARATLMHQRQRAAAAKALVRDLTGQVERAQAAMEANPLRLESVGRINHRLARIDSLAGARGLELRDVQPGRVAQSNGYQTVPLRITGTGSYQNCMQFLHDLHQTFRDTAVTGFRLSGSPQDGKSQTISFDFDLRWYASDSAVAAAQ